MDRLASSVKLILRHSAQKPMGLLSPMPDEYRLSDAYSVWLAAMNSRSRGTLCAAKCR